MNMILKDFNKKIIVMIASIFWLLSFTNCSEDMDILFNDSPKLNLSFPGTISATLIDSVYGTPISGANIEISNWEPVVSDTQTSNATGDFTSIVLPGPGGGPYTLTITHANYFSATIPVPVFGDIDLGDILLDPTVILTGGVFGEVQDTFQEVMPGATVTIQNSTGFISETVFAGVLGDFTFPSMPVCADCYTITATMTGYNPGSVSNIAVTADPAPDTDAGIIYIESTTVASGTISGHVINSVDGTDVVGATVDIVDWTSITDDTQITNSTGDFSSITLDGGEYMVIVSMPGYNSTTITDVAVSGGNADQGNILLVPTVPQNGSLSGIVNDTYNVAISGATVNITSANGYVNLNETTDGSGNFSFSTVPACPASTPNCYTITATASGYNPATVNNITVTNGVNTDVGTIYLQSTTAISGTIRGTTLDAIDLAIIDGANVEISSWASTVVDIKTTDLSGFFQSNVLSPGAYTLTISKAAYSNTIISSVNVDGNVDLGNIYMDKLVVNTGSLFGQVVDLNWNPVPMADVTFDNTIGSITQTVQTDGSGNFNFAAVPEGSNFILQVSKAGYFPATKNNVTVNVSVANDAGIIFLVPTTASSGRFSGRVIDSYNGAPISGATVEFLDYNSVLINSQLSAADGTFTSAVMPPGSYTVIAKKTGYFDFVLDNRILDGNKNLNDLPLCEVLTGNQIRLYIAWAALPQDLDLHVVGPTSNADTGQTGWTAPDNRFHVFFQTDGYYEDTGLYTSLKTLYTTSLVLDDVDGSGPETINLQGNYEQGDYNFTAHLADAHFGNPAAYWYDGNYLPVARVYNSTGLVREIPFPSTAPAPAAYYWKICRINKFAAGDTDIQVTVPTANPYLFHPVGNYADKTLMDWTF